MKANYTLIGGKPYSEASVIMLPTKKESFITKNLYKTKPHHGNPLDYTRIVLGNANERGFEYQHLYIVNDDTIKDGDWVITKDYGIWEYMKAPCPMPYWGNSKDCKKIIALTDTIIVSMVEDLIGGKGKLLPRPSNEFIEAYVKVNAKGFDKVLVEYEREGVSSMDGTTWNKEYKLKTALDNTVTIKKFEENPIQEILQYMVDHHYNKTNPVLYDFIAKYYR